MSVKTLSIITPYLKLALTSIYPLKRLLPWSQMTLCCSTQHTFFSSPLDFSGILDIVDCSLCLATCSWFLCHTPYCFALYVSGVFHRSAQQVVSEGQSMYLITICFLMVTKFQSPSQISPGSSRVLYLIASFFKERLIFRAVLGPQKKLIWRYRDSHLPSASHVPSLSHYQHHSPDWYISYQG